MIVLTTRVTGKFSTVKREKTHKGYRGSNNHGTLSVQNIKQGSET